MLDAIRNFLKYIRMKKLAYETEDYEINNCKEY